MCETPLAVPRIMSRLRKDSVRGDCHVCDHSLGDMVGHAGDSALRGPCGEWCSLPSSGTAPLAHWLSTGVISSENSSLLNWGRRLFKHSCDALNAGSEQHARC